MRRFAFIYLLLALTAASLGQTRVATESGTILVFGLSKNEIVVAADSRNLGDYGEVSDHECKIMALGDGLFFASSGMATAFLENVSNPSDDRIVLMDAYKEASVAFQSTPPDSDHFLGDVTTRWAAQVSNRLNKAVEAYGVGVLGNQTRNIVTGLFLGASSTGSLGFYYQDVFRDGNKVAFDPETGSMRLTDDMVYLKSGVFGDTFDEIQAGKTDRAKQEARPWLIFPETNWRVWKAVRLVQLTLADHPDKAGKPSPVGGSVDALTLTANGVRWFSRKKECEH